MSAGKYFSMVRTRVNFSAPSLFGDPRLFNIVKAGKTSANLCQSTRPDGPTFFNFPILKRTLFIYFLTQDLMEPEGLLQPPQEHSAGFCLKPDKSSPNPKLTFQCLSFYSNLCRLLTEVVSSLQIFELKSHHAADVRAEIRTRFLQNTECWCCYTIPLI